MLIHCSGQHILQLKNGINNIKTLAPALTFMKSILAPHLLYEKSLQFQLSLKSLLYRENMLIINARILV